MNHKSFQLSPPPSRAGGILACCVLMVFFLLFLPEILIRAVTFVFLVTFGWVRFLRRVVPEMTVDMPQVFITLAAIVLFVAGLHVFLRWLVQTGNVASHGQWRLRWTASIATLVLFMFAAGTAMVGVVHQVAWLARSDEPWYQGNARESAWRAASAYNLASTARAVLAAESRTDALPAGSITDGDGNRLHGWMTSLLPYFEDRTLHALVRLDEPWDAPVNRDVFTTRVAQFQNPALPHTEKPPEFAIGDYASNALVIGPGPALSEKELTDGTSTTILAGEVVAGRKPWGHPENWRDFGRGFDRESPNSFGGPWKNGATAVLFADGHVQLLSSESTPRCSKLSPPRTPATQFLRTIEGVAQNLVRREPPIPK